MRNFVLLSGGLDSTTLLSWVRRRRPDEPVRTVTFLYGQKHAIEVEAAHRVAAHYSVPHTVVELPHIRGSALTDEDAPLPEGRDLAGAEEVAPSYVPARNLLFVASLASLADADGSATLWLGVHRDDHTGYPDCRPEFVEAADRAVRLGTQYEIRVEAPFVTWLKSDILAWGLENEVPYGLTHSCYQGLDPACGVCDTCLLRRAAFAEAGAVDPIPYRDGTTRRDHGGGRTGVAEAKSVVREEPDS